jgi:chromosome partitioning protein
MAASDFKLIAVVSPKGGVGKTTVAANLAAALAARGRAVVAVDLDAQNALRLHHQLPFDDEGGLAPQTVAGASWKPALKRGAYGVDCLPYGTLDERDEASFERCVEADPSWLSRGLQGLDLAPGSYVIVDTPPGSSPYLRQTLGAAQLAIAVLLPDAASFVTIPTMENWFSLYGRGRPGFRGAWYLINRMNSARVLCRDVGAALQSQLGERLIAEPVRFDAAAEEALASQSPIAFYSPDSVAARDFVALADWVGRQL